MKIIFVCTGNTCRSPMAEAIFNSFNENSNVLGVSFGLFPIPNSEISKFSEDLIYENLNLKYHGRKAQKLTEADIKEGKYIFTMTESMKNMLKNNFPEYKSKIYTISEFADGKGDIQDPFGGNREDYKKTYEELYYYLEKISKKINDI